jgi:long-subunit acyl-CoA synthetase (AMP-forming)
MRLDYWTSLFSKYSHHLLSLLDNIPKASPPSAVLAAEQSSLTMIRESMGSRILLAGTGGAKISNAVLDWIAKALQCGVINAYGTSEVTK